VVAAVEAVVALKIKVEAVVETVAVVGVKVVEAAGRVAGVIPSLARLSKCST